MKRILLGLLIGLALLPLWNVGSQSSTCAEGTILAMDATNNRARCVTFAAPTQIFRATGLNVNQTNTDIGSFTNLPSRYIVRRLTVDNASATPTLSTVSLRTATGGAGTAIVNAQALSGLTAATTFLDSVLAVTTSVQTTSTLTIRAVAAAGAPATCDFTLEITPLP